MPTLFLRPKKGAFVMPSTKVASEGETRVIRVQRQLLSPNKLKNSWALFEERKQWTRILEMALALSGGFLSVEGWRLESKPTPPETRMHVHLRRECPSVRNFIQDAIDNRQYAYKPILDALKHVALIHDDKERWVTGDPLEQVVSADGLWWTEIRLTPAGPPLPLAPRKSRAKKGRAAA